MAGGGPLAWRVPSSINCMACGCLAQSPGSHSCSASLSSAWGPLEEHGAGLPAWSPQEKPGPGTAPGVNRSSQGMPKGCAQPVGTQSCPQPPAPPVLGLGLSSPSTASTLGSFHGVGCACGAFCMRVVVPLCCPHVHPHACLCDCVHVCVHSGVCPCVSAHVSVCVHVCPCESMCVSVCIPVCCHVSVHPTIHLWGATDREGLAWGDWGHAGNPLPPWGKGGSRVQGVRV